MRTFTVVCVLCVASSFLVSPSGGGGSSEVNWKRGVWFPVDSRARNNLEGPPAVGVSPLNVGGSDTKKNNPGFSGHQIGGGVSKSPGDLNSAFLKVGAVLGSGGASSIAKGSDTTQRQTPNFSRDEIGPGLPLISDNHGNLNDAFSQVGRVFGSDGSVGGYSNVGKTDTTTREGPNFSRDLIGGGFPLISENPGDRKETFLKVGKDPLSIGVGSYVNVGGAETTTRKNPNFSRDQIGGGLPLISENPGSLNDAFSKVGRVFGNGGGGGVGGSGNGGSLDQIGPPPLETPPKEVGLTLLQPAGWKWTEKSLLVPVTHPSTPLGGYGGWGWPPTTFPPKSQGGWGWQPSRDACADISNLTITRVAELHPDLRIVEVHGREMLRELNSRILQDVRPQGIPSPPVQLTTESAEKYETTFYDALSVRVENPGGFRGSSEFGGGKEEENVILGSVSILKMESIAMPPRGKIDKKGFFDEGLRNALRARERRETANPVASFLRKDLLFAGELFERLLAEGEESEETPILVSRVEKRTFPDVDSSERTALDAQFNFGLPAGTCEFQSVRETVEEWREVRRERKQRRRRPQVSSVGGFLERTEEFVRKRLDLGRTVGLESFEAAEERVQREFFVSQFLLCPRSSGVCEECPLEPTCDSTQVAMFSAGSGSIAVRRRAAYKSSGSLCSHHY